MMASFLASLIIYFRPVWTHRYLLFFPPFLLATVVIEAWGSYQYSRGQNNLAVYNFFTVIEFCFYLWALATIIHNNFARRVIYILMVAYAVASTVNILFYQGLHTFHTITYALGCLLIAGVCVYYFLELFRLPKSIGLINNPAFWICSGLLFYYCCGFPLFALINQWQEISPLIVESFVSIVTILNIFLYSLFTIAFLCMITRKYISSRS